MTAMQTEQAPAVWDAKALRLLVRDTLTHAAGLCLLAYNKVTPRLLYSVVMTAPMREQVESKTVIENAFRDAHVKAYERECALRVAYEDGLTWEEWEEMKKDYLHNLHFAVPESRTYREAHFFFHDVYAMLDADARRVADLAFTGLVFSAVTAVDFGRFCRKDGLQVEGMGFFERMGTEVDVKTLIDFF